MNRLVNRLHQMHYRLHVSVPRSNCMFLLVRPILTMSNNPTTARHALLSRGVSVSCENGSTLQLGSVVVASNSRAFTQRISTSKRYATLRRAYANGGESTQRGYYQNTHAQIIQNSTSNPVECWQLFQNENCSVKEIAGRSRVSEFEVYSQILWCVQQGRVIDWIELCQEAGFTPAIVLDINRAKAEAALSQQPRQQLDELDITIPVQCGPHVTDIHVLLYNTMLFCGVTPEMLFGPLEEHKSKQLEHVAPPKKVCVNMNAVAGSKIATASLGLVDDQNVKGEDLKQTLNDKSNNGETDSKKAPKRLTQKHMLQWMADQDGASLLQIVVEFKDYNECQLMRLILLLERKKLIYLRQGIFRVIGTSEESSS